MRHFLQAVVVALSALAICTTAHASQSVLQRGYDAGVSGANLTEVALNISNVAPATFGLVFKLPVDDKVYAQPLYVPGVVIPNQGTHNVVYVATMSDTLFAFDADTGTQLWSVNFASSVGATPVAIAQFTFAGNNNITGNLGILSTPVIDPSTSLMYLVACTLEGGTMVYRLHAVNIATGIEPYANVVISGSYGGVTFYAPHQTQRVSLVLSGNQVVFAFAAIEAESDDIGGYVGWVMAYNKTTLAQSGAFATVTTGSRGGGVWQSGRPPVVDSLGCVYVFVGNGYSSGYNGVDDFSESALRLDPANGLNLLDWFTPSNWSAMDSSDLDLASSGPLLIPGTSLLAGGGKTGILYVLNTNNMGHYSSSDSGVVQKETIAASSIRGGPVYWQRSAANGGPLLYDWGSSDWVKAYAFNGTTFAATPSYQGSGTQIYPGGILTLSANADTPGSGVLWATVAASGNVFNDPTDPGILYAYDADNVSTELWNSTMNSARDNFGTFAKFVPPLVVNGKVYVATFSNQVAVYGLLSSYTVSPASLAFGNELINVASAPKSFTVTNTGTLALPITSIQFSTTSPQPFAQTNNCGSSIAVSASCTFNITFDPSAVGSITATITINVGNGIAAQTVALSGTGVVPTYTVSPTSLAFGNELINVASTPKSIAITNTGVVALPITSIGLSTSGSQPFSQTNNCGSSVAVGASCTISVVFNPASTGSAAAVLTVNSGSGAATQTVVLGGTGVVPTYTASPTPLAFGNELTNVASAPKSITVTNTGVVALPITSIGLSTSGSQPFSQTNSCGSPVAVGASCAINVVFNPASTGSAAAVLSVNAGSGAATQTVALSGTGIVPTYTVSPASLAFGNELTDVASAPKSITITNTGVATLPITSIGISTPGSQPFSQTNSCGSPVAVGASCTINVVFNPASTGSAAAMLSVHAGNGAATQTVALSGTGVVTAYTVSPVSLAFGNELIDVASAPKSITITNTGLVALPITSIGLSAAGSQPFSQTNTCGSSVAVGANCTINVVFNPASTGSATATLSVNAGNRAATQTVALRGTGVVTAYTVSPVSLAFGNELTNVPSTPKSITITNTGLVTLPITSIGLSTAGSQPFSQTNTCGSSVAVGANCTIGVVFNPASTGLVTAMLSVNAGNRAATQTVALRGTGTAPAVTLVAAPSSVTVGNSVTLTWTSSNAASCVAGGGQAGEAWAGTKSTNGAATVTPSAAGTISYTMDCSSGTKSAQASAQVVASSPPSSSGGGGGGGALDTISLLSLLTMFGLQQRKRYARVVR
jgi:PQQ enzyme repeat